MKDFFPILAASPLFSGVTENELDAMLTCLAAKTEQFPKDVFLLHPGDAVKEIGMVLSGCALVVQEDIWGSRNVSVVTETPTAVLFLNVKRLLTVCPSACAHHSRIIRNLLSDLAGKNLLLNEKLTHIAQRTTRAKLMSYLSAEAQRRGAVEFDIPFSRQQLADFLAVERSGLSLELGKMKKEGLLDYHKEHFVLNI